MAPSPLGSPRAPAACFMNELSNFCKFPSLLRKQQEDIIMMDRNIDEINRDLIEIPSQPKLIE